MVLVGAVAGLALGMASVRYIESLLYQVKPTDLAMLALPSLTIIVAALLAALPAVIHAVRIDPATMLAPNERPAARLRTSELASIFMAWACAITTFGSR